MSFRLVPAMLLATAFLTHWFVPSTAHAGFNFSDVQKAVANTKSVQYQATRMDRTKENRVAPQESRTVMILDHVQMREQIKITTAGDPLPKGQTWGSRLGEDYVMVQNAKTGDLITLYPREKGFAKVRVLLGIDSNSGEIKETEVKPTAQVPFYAGFAKVAGEKVQRLSDREIDGKMLSVFQTVEEHQRNGGKDTFTHRYLVDPDTKLPVQIEASIRSTSPQHSDSDFVQKNFVFDAPLDEALFSTKPPEGYKDISAEEAKKDDALKAEPASKSLKAK